MPEKYHVYTTSHLFAKTKDVLKQLVAANKNIRRALDVPAGAGALADFLKNDLKLDVRASDIDTKKWEHKSIPIKQADLGRKLPFKSGEFDLVVCLEGLKHVSDLTTAMKELSRVLKKGGYMLITIPNDLNMETRFNYFFNGFVDTDWKLIKIEADEVKSHLYVRSLISLPYLSFYFQENKLTPVSYHASRLRVFSVFLAVLFYPFIFWRTRKAVRGDSIGRAMTSMTWLAGRHNIVVCRKG